MRIMKRRLSDAQLPDQDIHIPLELCREILARLPVKSLLKFRCVCKTWYSLIDSKDFIPMHLKLSNNNCYLLFMEKIKRRKGYECMFTVRSTDPFRITHNLSKLSGYWTLVGSCNGLVLLRHYHPVLRLWNPCIRSSFQLPSGPLVYTSGNLMNYLLGYSSSGDDYKVLAVRFDDGFVSMTLYSLRNRAWNSKIKRINAPIQWLLSGLRSIGNRVLFQGAWFWIGRNPETHLVTFDFDSEEFCFVKLPDVWGEKMTRFIFVLGDSLAILSMSSKSFCIWVLQKDTKTDPWRLWFSTDSNYMALKILGSSAFRDSRIFYNQDSDTFILQSTEKLISYKITTHQVRVLRKSIRGTITLDAYVESLVLHKGTTAVL